jgi:tetrahydromethanopterin S-methyltransferase subunit H
MLDLYAGSGRQMVERLSFAAEVFEGPILLDSTEFDARRAGVELAAENGFLDRIIYNSVNVGITPKEWEFLSESGVGSAIVLAFNPADNTLVGRLRVLDDGAGIAAKGLLDVARDCGIKRILLDTGVTPVGAGAGSALRAVPAFKAKYGLPTGNGIHNAVSSLKWDMGKVFLSAEANALAAAFGADFLLYGPIEEAEGVFNAVAFVECLLGDASAELGLKIRKDHPFRKLVG